MPPQTSFRKLILGVLAGLLSSLFCVLLAYVVGIVATAWNTKEVFATVLTALTVLPLMLLLVLLAPTIIIALGIGIFLGLVSHWTNRGLMIMGGIAGAAISLILLSVILPLIVPGDFTAIVSRYLVSLTYGFVLGLVTAWFFRRMTTT
jgi:hypothetical protein